MRYIVMFFMFIISIYLTNIWIKNHRQQETDKEVCDSTGLECGINITITNDVGNRNIRCECNENESCDLKNYTCGIHKIVTYSNVCQ